MGVEKIGNLIIAHSGARPPELSVLKRPGAVVIAVKDPVLAEEIAGMYKAQGIKAEICTGPQRDPVICGAEQMGLCPTAAGAMEIVADHGLPCLDSMRRMDYSLRRTTKLDLRARGT